MMEILLTIMENVMLGYWKRMPPATLFGKAAMEAQTLILQILWFQPLMATIHLQDILDPTMAM